MALETNSGVTFSTVGIMEDVHDLIYNVDPHEVPFLSMVDTVSAKNTYHEWQTDNLDTPSTSNAHLEGDAFSADTPDYTTRLGNYTQISKKRPRVSGTQRAVSTYGRDDELDYQIMRAGKALKTDIESAILDNKAQVAGNATTARETAGIESWFATNSNRGTGGADPTGDGTDTASDGTQRAFKESQLKDVLQQCYSSGGNPDCVFVGPFNKQQLSTFAGNATRFDKSEDKKLVAAVDVYVSDFGSLQVIPSRHVRARSALVLQKDMWCVAYLRPIQSYDVAKTGDTDAKELLAEYTLVAKNEKASGIVADLTTS